MREDVEAGAASRSRHRLCLCPPRRQPARPAGARSSAARARRRIRSKARSRVAIAAIEARDWDEARKALMPLLEGRLTQRVCTLMARIEGEQNGDAGRVREWLARAVNAPRDPAWTADGVVSERWAPISPVTGALDAFQWKVPVAIGRHGATRTCSPPSSRSWSRSAPAPRPLSRRSQSPLPWMRRKLRLRPTRKSEKPRSPAARPVDPHGARRR